ncbi:MAG: CPBP family intramembrane metalloprotease [Candidatus Dormibacteraeota bacterium]|nr:CPBP family intramembrane metalloprotease [Candidatus Dormibacteraeota bacterium]
MIALPVRLVGPAARVSGLILAAAALRSLLLPLGDGLSTAAFGICLGGITWAWPHEDFGGDRWGRGVSVIAGLCLGVVLVTPLFGSALAGRPLAEFWQWGAIAAAIATLEEVAIRGRLQQCWTQEAGPVAAIVIGAAVFAVIHLSRYGVTAMPLDFAVGLALGGLRAVTGRVMPGALAHVMADWGAWFWA